MVLPPLWSTMHRHAPNCGKRVKCGTKRECRNASHGPARMHLYCVWLQVVPLIPSSILRGEHSLAFFGNYAIAVCGEEGGGGGDNDTFFFRNPLSLSFVNSAHGYKFCFSQFGELRKPRGTVNFPLFWWGDPENGLFELPI